MATAPDPQIHIVDDDGAVRDAVRELVETAGMRGALYSSAEEFLAACDAATAGCLLLDIRLGGLSGLELQERLRERACDLPVIMLTGHGDVPAATRAFKQGAFDFVQKPFDPPALLECLRRALQHHARQRQERSRRTAAAVRLAALSPREREVFEHLAEGLSNKQIAAALHIAERTVEFHRAHILEKTGTRTLPELLRLGLTATVRDPFL